MKWGVRRYRNKDGSLTPAGKKRYRYDYPTSRKEVRKMSDKDLTDRITRLKMEKEYLSLAGENIDQGKHYVNNTIKNAGTTAVNTFTKALATAGANFVVKMLFNKLSNGSGSGTKQKN